MGFRVKRRTFKIGQSIAVTLPLSWCRYYSDRIETVTMVGDGILILAPTGLEETALRIIEGVENTNALKVIR